MGNTRLLTEKEEKRKFFDIKRCTVVRFIRSYITDLFCGYRIYKRIVSVYEKDTYIFLCSPRGTGDIYIIGCFLSAFLEKNGITKYAFVYRGQSEKRVGKLFGIMGDLVLNDHEIWLLNRFFLLYEKGRNQFIELHHYMYPEQLHLKSIFFEGYKGWYFKQLIKTVGMGLVEEIEEAKPRFAIGTNVEGVFNRLALKKGRTVIVSPFSSSINSIPPSWWVRLVALIKANGFKVATNVASNSDKPIAGSEALEISYENLKEYLEYGGIFVGTRSGLCDIISTIDCKKIILTPYYAEGMPWGNFPGKAYEFYNMNRNYPKAKFIELEYDKDHLDVLQNAVIMNILCEEEGISCSLQQVNSEDKNSEKHCSIVYVVDKKEYPFFLISMQSVIRNSHSIFFDINVFGIDLSDDQKSTIRQFSGKEINVFFLDYEKCFYELIYKYYRSKTDKELFIFMLPYVLQRYEYIFFMSNFMVINHDINFMWDLRSDKPFASSYDISAMAYYNSLHSKQKTYTEKVISVDFVIFNTNKFIREIAVEQLIQGYERTFILFSSWVMKLLGKEKIKILSQAYNFIIPQRAIDDFFCTNIYSGELLMDYFEAKKEPYLLNYKNIANDINSKYLYECKWIDVLNGYCNSNT